MIVEKVRHRATGNLERKVEEERGERRRWYERGEGKERREEREGV